MLDQVDLTDYDDKGKQQAGRWLKTSGSSLLCRVDHGEESAPSGRSLLWGHAYVPTTYILCPVYHSIMEEEVVF